MVGVADVAVFEEFEEGVFREEEVMTEGDTIGVDSPLGVDIGVATEGGPEVIPHTKRGSHVQQGVYWYFDR